jgi:hypothetical protein
MNLPDLLFRLNKAFNLRNIDQFVDCFADDYRSEQPLHPNRAFIGKDQVRKNWGANFIEMPDFTAELLSHQTNNNTVWAEWDWKGTRQDKSTLHMRGVTIFGIENNKINWGRLYMEPVQTEGPGIEAAVKKVMHGKN